MYQMIYVTQRYNCRYCLTKHHAMQAYGGVQVSL
jgi:hypothetical protein